MATVPDFAQVDYVTLLTRQARIKRVKMSEFASVRPSGIIAMNLEPGDELAWACVTNGEQEFMIVTADGKAVRFSEKEVRAMGRTAAGVRAIKLQTDDRIIGFDVVEPDGELLVLAERGHGKRSPLAQYPTTGPQRARRLDHRSYPVG